MGFEKRGLKICEKINQNMKLKFLIRLRHNEIIN